MRYLVLKDLAAHAIRDPMNGRSARVTLSTPEGIQVVPAGIPVITWRYNKVKAFRPNPLDTASCDFGSYGTGLRQHALF